MTAPRPRPKQLDAGILRAEISLFALAELAGLRCDPGDPRGSERFYRSPP
jgi:hypothetical protein